MSISIGMATTISPSWRAVKGGKRSKVVLCVSAAGTGNLTEQYRMLRVQPGASEKEVKKAFRRLALQVHYKWYQSIDLASMADGTRYAQLSESVAQLREEQSQQRKVLEAVLQKLNTLATNYEQIASTRNGREDQYEGDRNSNGQGQSFRAPISESNWGIQARTIKLDFPKFNGSEPNDWVMKVEQFFEYFQTPEDQKLELAFFHMERKALSWFVWLKESGPIKDWDYFVECLKTRFGPSVFEDPIGAFTKLRQINSVEEYQTEFENLSNKVKRISEEFRISTFISGLKDELKLIVTMFKPSSLSAAFGLAKLQEEESNRRTQGNTVRNFTSASFSNSRPTISNNQSVNSKQIVPASKGDNGNTSSNTGESFSKKFPFQIKRLTPAQMQERREKGLCYNCDDKYHFGHKCSKPRILFMEATEIENGELEESIANFNAIHEEGYAQGGCYLGGSRCHDPAIT